MSHPVLIPYNRRISNHFTQWIAKTPLMPNHITTLGLISALVGSYWMSRGTHMAMIGGAFCFHLAFILDNCDGEIARLKKLKTSLGAKYDLVADVLVDLVLWLGLMQGAIHHSVSSKNTIVTIALIACVGSFINALVVVWERKRGCHDSHHVDSHVREERKGNLFFEVLSFLGRNGDTAIFIWIFAILGWHYALLLSGAIFVNALWLTHVIVNRKHLL